MKTALCFILVVLSLSLVGLSAEKVNYDVLTYRDHPCMRQCEDNALPRTCQYHFLLENYYVLSKACFDCPFNQSHCYLPHCVSADGVSRGIKTANRILPGPPVEVCEGDTIEVTVENRMEMSESTSIHWHGILQRGSQHMDGVSLVTQCPISPHSKFTYRFKAENPGTHFWHSHSGLQRADGLFGSLIVRRPPSLEPHIQLYDHDLPEHVIIITDWLVEMTINRFAAHHHDDGDNKPKLMLINGMGQHEEFKDDNDTSHFTPRATFTVQGGEKYRFRVISSAIMNCPIQVSIDGHTMTMIASDGNSFEPFVVDSFNIFAGERYDFVFFADKTDTLRNYWIRVRGLADCSVKSATQTAILMYEGAPDVLPPEPTTWADAVRDGKLLNPWNKKGTESNVEVSRMLSTDPDDDTLTSEPDKKFYLAMDFNKIDNPRFNNPEFYPLNTVVRKKHLYSPQINHITSELPPAPPLSQYDDIPELLNPWNKKGTESNVEVSRMLSTDPDDDTLTSEPDKKFYLAMDFNKIDNPRFNNPEFYPLNTVVRKKHLYSPQINHITSELPPAPPLSQYDDIPEELYCNAETVQKHCDQDYCSCVHLYQVALGDVVELVIIDEGVTFDANHPMHLHGYNFRVVGLDRVNKSTSLEEIKEMDARGELKRTLTRAPLKDTVTVPDGGYTIIRFKADNPGIWFFHCHIEFHAEIGMGLLFQVGTKDQLPKRPKNFPACGHWHFQGYEEDQEEEHVTPMTKTCPTGNSATSPTLTSFAALSFTFLLTCYFL